MTVVGSAEILVTANTAGFESEIAATDMSSLSTKAEKAGSDAGLALSSGVKDGTKDLETDLEDAGEKGGSALEGGLSSHADGIKSVLGNLGVPSALMSGWGAFGLAVVGVGVSAVDLGEKMQSADTAIATASDSSVKSATAIGNAFLGTAGTSEFSGKEIATAYATVAGQLKATEGQTLSTKDAMTVMGAAQDLATAKQIDLGTATSTLAGVMQAFQLPVKDAASATDVLFNTSNATGQGVDAVGAALDRLKSKLGDTSPPIGALASLMVDMTNNGITGRAALTGVNTAMTGLSAAAAGTTTAGKAAETELQSFGVSATTASGQLTPMSAIIEKLGPQFAKMSQAQQLAAATTIFGASAAKDMVSIIDAGPAAYDKASTAVNKMGAAHAAAALQSKTLGVEIKTIKSTVEDWLTMLGEKLIPVLTVVVGWIGSVLPSAISIGKDAFDGLKVVLTPLIDVVKVLFSFLEDHKPILIAVGVAIGLIFAPVTTLIVGIGLLATHWADVWTGIKKVVSDFVGFFTAIPGEIEGFFKDIIDWITSHWQLLAEILIAPIAPVIAIFVAFHDQIIGFVSDLINKIVGFFTALPGEIVSGLGDIVTTVWKGFTTAADWINTNVIQPVVKYFTALPGNIVTGLGDIVTTIWKDLVDAARWVDTNVIEPVITYFTNLPGKIVTGLGDIVTTIWHGLLTAATWIDTNVIEPVFDYFDKLPGRIASGFGNIISVIFKGWDQMASWVDQNVIEPIINFFKDIPAKIGNLGSSILKDITGGLGNIASDVGSFLGLATGGIVNKPTLAVVGESGPEAVIPLSMFASPSSAGSLPSASSSGSGGVILNVNPGAVVINPAPGNTAASLASTQDMINNAFSQLRQELEAGFNPIGALTVG